MADPERQGLARLIGGGDKTRFQLQPSGKKPEIERFRNDADKNVVQLEGGGPSSR